jgi:filamentous hemagglutinin family protein
MRSCFLVAIALLSTCQITAKPHGFHVRSGDASAPVQDGDGRWVVASGKRALIDWASFNIDEREAVHFAQADKLSYVLNRVVDDHASHLMGSLSSNGSVYLINPHGILIGKEARIEAAGFVASTLDLLNEDLSRRHFGGDSDQAIVHEGVIRCEMGDVFLIGKTVDNRGVIETPQGRQGILSGCDIWIEPEGAPHVVIHTTTAVDPEAIQENPYAYAIRHTGTSKGQEIYVTSENGITEVGGKLEGETVHILGEVVHIAKTAEVDVSGTTGGGVILVGGDYQGKNPDVRNADQVWFDAGASLKADALENGNGGKIILWGNQANVSAGWISAQGGPQGGDGGFVEISSPVYLVPNAIVSTLAPLGKTGLLYYDPCAVTISAGADANNSFAAGAYTFSAATSTINIPNLITNLSLSNVTIDATASGSGTASITVAAPIAGAGGGAGGESWTNNSLTLTGGTFITVNAASAISWTGTGALTMTAGSGPVTIGSSITGGGAITISGDNSSAGSGSGVSISTSISNTSGALQITGLGANTTPSGNCHGINLTGGTVSTSGSGSVTLNGTGGASSSASHGIFLNGGKVSSSSTAISLTGVNLGGTGTSSGIFMGTANGITSSSGSITLSGTSAASGFTNPVPSCGVYINQSWTTGTTQDLIFTSCQGGSSIANAGIFITGVTVSSGGNITATNAITSGPGGGSTTGGGISIVGTGSGLTSTGGGNIALTATFNGAPIGNSTAGIALRGGTLSTTGNGSITLIGSYTPTSGTSATPLAGVLITNLPGTITTQNGNINIAGTTSNFTNLSGNTASGVFMQVSSTFQTTGGNINISGTCSTLGGGTNIGVSLVSPRLIASAGSVNFGSTIQGVSGCQGGGGPVAHGLSFSGINSASTALNFNFTNCIGGAGGGNGHGINLPSTNSSLTGNFTATTGITGGGDTGIGVNAQSLNLLGAGNTLTITASGSSTGVTGPCHGIAISSGAVQTSNAAGGAITLVGIAGSSQAGTASHGISIDTTGSISTAANNSPISLTGTGGTGAGGGHGINLASSATNSVTTGATGAITLSGTGSTNNTAGFDGVSINTNTWTPNNGGLLTFTNCTGGAGSTSHGVDFTSSFVGSSDVTFSSCTGGSGGGNGINVASAFSTTGTITATSQIAGGGPSGIGFSSGANFLTSGSGKTIAITASGTSTSTTGACHGISVTAGTLQTSSASGGGITLIGTGGTSTTASHGVNISGSGLVTTLANNSAISVTGTGGAGSGGGNGINLVSSANSITSGASGTITLTGTGSSNASSTSHGVAVNTNTWSPGNGGLLTFINCAGGAGAGGNGVNFDTVFTGSGNIAFTNCVRGSSTGFGVRMNANFSTSGSINFTSTTPSTSGFFVGSAPTTITGASFVLGSGIPTTLSNTNPLTINTSGSNGAVTFGGTVDDISAFASALTLTAGSGTVTFSGNVGSSVPIGALNVTGGAVTFSANVSASTATVNNSGLLTTQGNFQLATTFSQTGAGLVSLGGNISTITSDISFNEAISLTNAVTLTTGSTAGGTITLPSTVNGAFGFTLIGQTIAFDGAIGNTTPLASLQATAATINISADQTVSTGPMSYSGNVVLNTNIQLTDSGTQGLSFSASSGDAITSASGHAYNLTLRALNTSIAVTSGDVVLRGTSGASGGALSATAGTGITFGGQILTQGGDNVGTGGSGGNVTLSCSAGSISFHNINTSGGASSGGTGGNAGAITIQPASGYSGGLPIGIITINNDLSGGLDGNLVALAGSSGGTAGAITLSANRSSAATVATIASSLSGNNIVVRGASVSLGPFEAMTALGNMTLTADVLTLGDLVALNTLDLTATTINLNTHGDISLLNNLGGLYTSPTLHFLGGTGYFATGTFIPSGPVNAQNLNLSPSTFEPLLKFNTSVLNYDTTFTPTPPTPTPTPSSATAGTTTPLSTQQELMYKIGIADAQLTDLLPVYPTDLPPPFCIWSSKENNREEDNRKCHCFCTDRLRGFL